MAQINCEVCENDLGQGVCSTRGVVICNDCLARFKRLINDEQIIQTMGENISEQIDEPEPRKPIQILLHGDSIISLCNDGSMWQRGEQWNRIEDVPQPVIEDWELTQ